MAVEERERNTENLYHKRFYFLGKKKKNRKRKSYIESKKLVFNAKKDTLLHFLAK